MPEKAREKREARRWSSQRVSASTAVLCLCFLVTLYILFHSPPPSSIPARNSVDPDIEDEGAVASPYNKRIVAIGDLHGDLTHTTRILRHAGLIDLKGSWIGGEDVLVQTGDIVDRGKDTIALFRFMDGLRPQAEKAGGQVVSLLGNHEIMNAMGDWRYVTPEDIATFGGERQRRFAMTEGWIGQTWRTNYSITARVPYPPPAPTSPQQALSTAQLLFSTRRGVEDLFTHTAASFVHGGIIPRYINGLELPDETPGDEIVGRINEIGRGLMESLAGTGSPLSLPRNATKEQRDFWSSEGPMWDRSYALDEDEEALCKRATETCDLLNVRRLVMGHTPTFDHQVSRCDGRILLIDTGISRAYGGVLSALEITYSLVPQPLDSIDVEIGENLSVNEAAAREFSDGSGNWLETETVSALYVGRPNELMARSERVVNLD